MSRPISASAELSLLDDNGCLCDEVLCFIEQLHPDQQAVVQRHVRSCPICAQQQAALARAAARVYRSRPRLPTPGGARTAIRHAVLRSALERAAAAQPPEPAPRCWYRDPGVWIAAVAGLGVALLVTAIILMVY